MTMFIVVFEQNELYTKTFLYQNGIIHHNLPVLKNTTGQIDENMNEHDNNGYIDSFYTDMFVFPRTDTFSQLCAGCLNFVHTLTIKRELFTRRNDIANRLVHGYFHGYDSIDETLSNNYHKKSKIHYFMSCDNCNTKNIMTTKIYVSSFVVLECIQDDQTNKKQKNKN